MSRCDAESARRAGVNCADFYRLQALVADQVRVFRTRLRSFLSDFDRNSSFNKEDRATKHRSETYMGSESADAHDKIALVHNVLQERRDTAEKQ